MKKFLLDTHILIWLLTNQKKISNNILEDIEYFQHPYYASVESLREIVMLQALNKVELPLGLDEIVAALTERQIGIIDVNLRHVGTLEKLPISKINKNLHSDPFDRMLISQAIADGYTMVNSDEKFPDYQQYGLDLLVNE
jgi:PIN domain nuclease of toxin-antitoxin system